MAAPPLLGGVNCPAGDFLPGDPFTLKEHGDKALELYKRHLWNSIRDFPENLQALFRKRRRRQRVVRLTKFQGDAVSPGAAKARNLVARRAHESRD